MISFGAIKLGLAVAKRLSQADDRGELLQALVKAIGDDGKVTVIEWSTIGKRLGVFDTK